MKPFQFIFILLAMTCKAQTTPKLIVGGEHLGYKLQYFVEGVAYETTVSQGEKWFAVYSRYKKFETLEETIRWDSTMRINIRTDKSIQPYFYFQGFQPVDYGDCADVSFLLWTWQNKKYFTLNKNNPAKQTINAEFMNEIILEPDTFLIYSGVKNESMAGVQGWVMWAGDLNGDGEVDLVFRRSYTDTMIYDLVVSEKTNDKIGWKPFARFHEWN